jgi:hypothetical protein
MSAVELFEIEIAKFFGSPYAVATDCCTHAIELCLLYKNVKNTSCPNQTYLSIPMTFMKLNLGWGWTRTPWTEYYYLGNTNIIDAAVLWRQNSYIPNTLMCLSFQFKKHLSLGRGGAILCDRIEDYHILKKMTHDGRLPNIPWKEQKFDILGYHYYMTIDTAILGLEKLSQAISLPARTWSSDEYPLLSNYDIFKDVHHDRS